MVVVLVLVVLVRIIFFKKDKMVEVGDAYAGLCVSLTFMGVASNEGLTGVLLAVGTAIAYLAMLISVECTVLSILHCNK